MIMVLVDISTRILSVVYWSTIGFYIGQLSVKSWSILDMLVDTLLDTRLILLNYLSVKSRSTLYISVDILVDTFNFAALIFCFS